MSADVRRFTIGEALGAGWRTFLANIVPMALYALVVFAITSLTNLLVSNAEGTTSSVVANIIVFLVNQLVAIGWLRIALDAIDGERVTAERVTNSFRIFVPYTIAALVYSVLVALGLVVLIVPGIILAIVFGFYGWTIVDGAESEPIAALRHSAEITRGERWHLFGFGLLLLLLNILGLLVLIVGFLVTSAVTILALAYVYRQLETAGSPVATDPQPGAPQPQPGVG